MTDTVTVSYASPLGTLAITERDGAICRVRWLSTPYNGQSELLAKAALQLDAYFAGELTQFSLPISPGGTPFDMSVWAELGRIPYGTTCTYGSIARSVGGISRAVGTACGRNPIPIIVPCHRVVSADGSLGGFSGGDGLPTKRSLLELEGLTLQPPSDNREQLSLF